MGASFLSINLFTGFPPFKREITSTSTLYTLQMVVRLGILSSARIANVVASAEKQVDGLEVVAVASRSPSKAKSFCEPYGIERTCTYDELIAADDIDAVYIPLPTALATKWAERAATAGKHVLVDKPFASAAAVKSITEAASAAGVVFLDGTHFVHSGRSKSAREFIRESCGEPRIVKASFSAPIDLTGDIRTDITLEPHGAVGDLGWYCARAAVFFLGAEKTSEVKAAVCLGSFASEGWSREASGVVEFTSGAKLSMDCSFDTVFRQRVEVAGTKGTIRINDFVTPDDQVMNPGVAQQQQVETELVTDTGVWRKLPTGADFPCPSSVESKIVDEGSFSVQPVRMLREFVRMIETKDLEASTRWARESIATQQVVDALYHDCIKRMENQ